MENLQQHLSYVLKRESVGHVSPNASRILQQQQGHFISSSIGQILTYDKRNSRRDPTAGYSISLSNTFAGVGGNVGYLKNALEGSVFYSPVEDVVFKTQLTVGNILKTGKPIRVIDSILLGDDSFRGFRYGGIGPCDASTGDPLGGLKYWVGTVEAIFPIGLPNEFGVKGALFTDFGAVWEPTQTLPGVKINDSKSPRVSVGAGILWKSPFGPLRVDYAIPIKREKFDRVQHLTIGVSSRF